MSLKSDKFFEYFPLSAENPEVEMKYFDLKKEKLEVILLSH